MFSYFDAHCDTLTHAARGPVDFVGGDAELHMDLPRSLAAGGRLQVFAVFIAPSRLSGADLRAYTERSVQALHGWIDASCGRMQPALTREDIAAAERSDALFAMLSLEGCDPLEGDPDALQHFYELGLRSIIPAWEDNAFAGTPTGSGAGLTSAGIRLVENAEALGVMVDVSHLSDAGFDDVCAVAHRPFIASHSNCRSLCPAGRNLTDEMIRTLADMGGVMGITFAPHFVGVESQEAWRVIRARQQATGNTQAQPMAGAPSDEEAALLRSFPLPEIDEVVPHFLHAIEVGGEESVGIGGDLDGIALMPKGMSGVEIYPHIAEMLVDAGITPRQVEKIFWDNMARVYEEVLP